jgi:calcineurin-like phosphoesterase family protein
MKVYITTDTHLGHAMLVGNYHRPHDFETEILSNLSRVEGDLLIHLGDICFGNDTYWHCKLMEAARHFDKKMLIRGNHDNKSYNWYIKHGFDSVMEFAQMQLFGHELLFSHKPILADEIKTTRYDKIEMNIHGHLHGKGKFSHRTVEGYTPGFHYDCAPDIHEYKPVDLAKLLRVN